MDTSGKLPTFRAFFLFICLELIAAGVLWLVGLLYPQLLIWLGALGLFGVWCWDKGHRWIAAQLAIVAIATVGVTGYIKFIRAPEKAEPAAQETAWKADPFNLCLVLLGVHQYPNDGLIKAIEIEARLVNRNTVPVNTVLLDRSVDIEGYPHNPDFVQAEPGKIYPEQPDAILTTNPVRLGNGLKPGTILHGVVRFVVRFGPDERHTATLILNYSLIIQLQLHRPSVVERTLRGDATGECPYQDQYVGPGHEFSVVTQNLWTRSP